MTSIINKVQTDIPSSTNLRIIDLLYSCNCWRFASDDKSAGRLDKVDRGLILPSYADLDPSARIESLNIYANIILDAICHKSFFKYRIVRTFRWNWYHSNSQGDFHQDDQQDNEISVIYNLHENDGGTEFRIGDKIEFFKAEPSQALIFPSKIFHRGIAPKEKSNRFCLNIITEI